MWVFVLVCHVDRMLLVGPVSAAGSRHIVDISLYGESGLSFTILPFQLIDGYRAIASASLGTQGGPTSTFLSGKTRVYLSYRYIYCLGTRVTNVQK